MKILQSVRATSKFFLAFASLLSISSAAWAGPNGDAAREKANGLSQRGEAIFAQANTAHDNGDNASACKLYREAAIVLENSIYASLGMVYDPDYDKDEIKAGNAAIQENVNMAKHNAEITCKVSAPPQKSAASLEAEISAWYSETRRIQLHQAQINTAWLNANNAAEHYAATRYIEACNSSRLATALYAQASLYQRQANDIAFFVMNKSLINENAAISKADEAEFYCKDAKVAAATPAAVMPTGTRQEQRAEGFQHQDLALKFQDAAYSAFKAGQFGQSCNHYRDVSDQWNQFYLLSAIYSQAPDALEGDEALFQKLRQDRSVADKNVAVACGKYKAEWSAKPWFNSDSAPDTALSMGGKDYSAGLKAFYTFARYWQNNDWHDKMKSAEMHNACTSAQAPYSPLWEACNAVFQSIPSTGSTNPCWEFKRSGIQSLFGIGGLRTPELGFIFEQLQHRTECSTFERTGYDISKGREGLQWADGLVVVVVKPIPNRPTVGNIVATTASASAKTPTKIAAKKAPAIKPKSTKARRN